MNTQTPAAVNNQPNNSMPQASTTPAPTPNSTPKSSDSSELKTLVETMMLQGHSRDDIIQMLAEQRGLDDKSSTQYKTLKDKVREIVTDLMKEAIDVGMARYFIKRDTTRFVGLYLVNNSKGDLKWDQLTTFTVQKMRYTKVEDGVGEQIFVTLVLKRDKQEVEVTLTQKEFTEMNFTGPALGTKAYVLAHKVLEAREAIQATAQELAVQKLYSHIGWRQIDGEWYYLHAKGAISKSGLTTKYQATFPAYLKPAVPAKKLNAYELPAPPEGEKLVDAINRSLNCLTVSDDPSISYPAYATVCRAPLGNADMTYFVDGPTGKLKTAHAKVLQQHFGRNFWNEELIEHFLSTDNSVNEYLFRAKDALALVDEFVPSGTPQDVAKEHKKADNILRSTANSTAKGRFGQDAHPPRALLYGTGEEIPRGHSLGARTIHRRYVTGTIDPARLTICQRDAKEGFYAMTMAAYLRWVANRMSTVVHAVVNRTEQFRDHIRRVFPTLHPKVATNLGSLALGFEMFLSFAVDSNAISQQKASEHWAMMWEGIWLVAEGETEQERAQDPLQEALRLLRSALNTKRLFVRDLDPDPGEEVAPPTGAAVVGYVETDAQSHPAMYYFDEEAVYMALARHYSQTHGGAAFPFTQATFVQRLADAGISKPEVFRSNGREKQRSKCRKRIDGEQQSFVCVPAAAFAEQTSTSSDESISTAQRSVPAFSPLR